MHLSSLTAWPTLLYLGSKSPLLQQYVFTDDLAFAYIYVYISIYFRSGSFGVRKEWKWEAWWPLRWWLTTVLHAGRSWDVANCFGGGGRPALDLQKQDYCGTVQGVSAEIAGSNPTVHGIFLRINQSGVPTGWVAFRWGRVRIAAKVQDQILIRRRTSCVLTKSCACDLYTLKSDDLKLRSKGPCLRTAFIRGAGDVFCFGKRSGFRRVVVHRS